MNASGLAAVMNSGEVCIDPPIVKGKKTTEGIIRAVLESCDNAAQAVALLKKFIDEGNYSHGKSGSIFLFMDQKEGYICEITSKVCSVQRYDSGYAVRASNWRNPGMLKYVRSDVMRFLKASGREYSAFSGLNKIIDNNGKIIVADSLTSAIEISNELRPFLTGYQGRGHQYSLQNTGSADLHNIHTYHKP